MAFLLVPLAFGAIVAVRDGIQAHKDYKHPDGLPIRFDRYGNVKKPRGGIYGAVIRVERGMDERRQKRQDKKRAKRGESSGSVPTITRAVEVPSLPSYQAGDYDAQDPNRKQVMPDSPPPYEQAMSRTRSHRSS